MATYRRAEFEDMEMMSSLIKWFQHQFKWQTGCEAELGDFLEFVEGHPTGVDWREE